MTCIMQRFYCARITCLVLCLLICLVTAFIPVSASAQQTPLTISPQNAFSSANKPADLQKPPSPSAPKSTKPKTTPQKTTSYPMPPMRPADLARGVGLSPIATPDTPKEGVTSPSTTSPSTQPSGAALVAQQPSRVVQISPKTEEEAALFLNAYFNSFAVMSGDFIQFGADGRRVEGRFELHKPGRLRFDYNPPSPLEIIADGQSVAIRDKRLNTQDLYPLSQTPLKFLLKARIDLTKESRIIKVVAGVNEFRTTIEDKATLGGTSQITLFYDLKARQLTRWEVLDPQGFETSVAIYNLNMNKVPAPARFKINQERTLEDRR